MRPTGGGFTGGKEGLVQVPYSDWHPIAQQSFPFPLRMQLGQASDVNCLPVL
jgi:hypothetical protein